MKNVSKEIFFNVFLLFFVPELVHAIFKITKLCMYFSCTRIWLHKLGRLCFFLRLVFLLGLSPGKKKFQSVKDMMLGGHILYPFLVTTCFRSRCFCRNFNWEKISSSQITNPELVEILLPEQSSVMPFHHPGVSILNFLEFDGNNMINLAFVSFCFIK